MSLANMFEHKCEPSEQNIKNYLTGNLCRCTGYQPIINAAKGVQADRLKRVSELYPVNEVKGRLKQECKSSLYIETGSRRFFAPVTLAEALEFKKSHPGVRIFSGATDLGVQINKGKDPGPMQMSLHLVDELYALSEKEGSIEVGARVTLDQLQDFIEDKIPELAKFLNIFASPQIKNSATLVGNLANGSPIADTTPALMVLDAQVELASVLGVRSISVAEFFKGYKEFHVHPDELITRIRIPAVTYKKMGLYKISQRRDLDISCVNAAFLVQSRSGQIQSLKIAFGGVAATPLRLKALESEIPNQRISNKLIDEIQSKIEASVQPLSDVRGSSEFRKKMAGQLWRKFAQEHLK